MLGWIMTFLDTVDGKLARVTLQASKVGHVMDHGLDIIHPPIWYWCWACGLEIDSVEFFNVDLSISTWLWWMLGAYLGGRIFEGLFQLFFNDISIFCWKPFDSYHRLLTARRNPCLILLTLAMLIMNPVLGFVLVVLWSVFSTMLLGLRLIQAAYMRLTKGRLVSWIEHSNPDQANPSLSAKMFTGYRALKTIQPLISDVK